MTASAGPIEEGSGLRGLADRIEALGGTLALESPPGGGTRLLATDPAALSGVGRRWAARP